MQTFKKIYTEKKTYSKYDDKHYLIYLNEEVIQDYVPEDNTNDSTPADPVTAYAYTGDFPDGGTMIEAEDASYDMFVSGLIRKKYTVDAESAIQSNMIVSLSDPKNDRAIDFENEWNEFQEYRLFCKSQASNFFK
ncbi:hypothetical protein DW945_22120 [Parabacteroides sp. AM44-16]|nr:hypothetical protein DW945_22120 [Parabacteroides sp. AM44-16]